MITPYVNFRSKKEDTSSFLKLRKTARAILIDAGPLILTIPILASPTDVAIAAIVSASFIKTST